MLVKIARIIESKLIFKESKKILPLIEGLQGKVLKKFFYSKDNIKLSYWHVKPSDSKHKVLYCHGNLLNLSHLEIQKVIEFLAVNGYEVFALDYRGFGLSEGVPSEIGVYTDLESMVNHLDQNYGISSEEIVIWGHSLGSAIVSEEASKRNFAAVILEGGFTSINDMRMYLAAHHNRKNTIIGMIKSISYRRLEITQKFETKSKIAKIMSPIFVIHSKEDEVIPFEMGTQLAELAVNADTYFPEKGSHVIFDWQQEKILEFLQKVC